MIIYLNIKIFNYGFYYFIGNNKVIIKYYVEILKNIFVFGIDVEYFVI